MTKALAQRTGSRLSTPARAMIQSAHLFSRWLRIQLKQAVAVMLITTLALGLSAVGLSAPAHADPLLSYLPPGNPITDGKALLRYALPIDNQAIRKVQSNLEEISEPLRARRRLSTINSNLAVVERILARPADLLKSVPEAAQPQAETLIASMEDGVSTMRTLVEAGDKEAIWLQRGELLDTVGELEELMVTDFPFEVPAAYSDLPQLKGRATIAMKTSKGDLKLVVDGYSAPVTAGNFVDLVQRGFYDGLEFTRAEAFYVVQAGDPPGPEDGFVDPATGETRTIPIEILAKGDKEPTYGTTLEAAGRYLDKPVLPFSAYGTLAMARPEVDPNGASSQFFFLLFESELTPAGANLLDGRYAIFGYVTENKEVLGKIEVGDKIESASVIEGAENLVQPQSA